MYFTLQIYSQNIVKTANTEMTSDYVSAFQSGVAKMFPITDGFPKKGIQQGPLVQQSF